MAFATTPASPFSYYAYDLLSGKFVGQVPLRTVSFGQQLNAAGTLAGTIDSRDPRVRETNPRACTIPNRTLIVADYKGSIVADGIVLPRKPNVDSTPTSTTGTMEPSCSSTWAYFAQRVQATDYSAPPYSGITGLTPMSLWPQTPWDASLIVCQLLEDAIGYSNHRSMPYGDLLGGLGVLLNGEVPSGGSPAAAEEFWIAMTYPYTSAQTIESIVSQIAQLGLGVAPDIGVDLAYSDGPGSPPIGTINVSHPRRGRTVEENHLTIDLTTARKYSFPEDGSEAANQVYEIGGSGALVIDQNIYPLEQGYPLWERVISRAQIQSQHITSILSQIGVSDLAMYSYAPVTPTVTLSAFDPHLPLGSYIVGDDVRIVMPALGPDGQVFDPEFPEGLDQEWRITGWKTTVADQGDAMTEFMFSQPPYLEAIAPAV
ncbi:MAG TPA: hypothetical protein VGF95_14475 [Solirubrobacteraceae bacterium]|jgi:hypothetical protein